MTTTESVESTDTSAAPAAGRARRRWPWLLLAGVVVLVVGTWLALGLIPAIGGGYASGGDPEAVDEPPGFVFGPDESTVTDPSDGTYDGFWTYGNDGLLPVTVRIAERDDIAFTWHAQLFALPADGGITEEHLAQVTDELTVEPGEFFGVSYSFGFTCEPFAAGGAFGIDSVLLEVTTLGLTRTVRLDGSSSISIYTATGYTPPADCGDTP